MSIFFTLLLLLGIGIFLKKTSQKIKSGKDIPVFSLGYFIFAFIYPAVTFFPSDFNCLNKGLGGVCGLSTALVNLPSSLVMFPILNLEFFGLNTVRQVPIFNLVVLYFALVFGWLIFVALFRFLLFKIIKKWNNH